jgi:hypothetical protein
MSARDLTPRSQTVWAAGILATAPDRAAVARRVGIPQRTLSRMLSSNTAVDADLARKIGEAAGLAIVERSVDGFTMEAA